MFDHAILTRFNLPSAGYEGFVRASPCWLENRMALFERYCLPAVLAQTSRNFQWLIFFDPQTPDWAKAIIQKHEALGYYRALYREAVPKDLLLRDLRAAFAPGNGLLLTTRLDNDDVIACDFVERLQHAVCEPGDTRQILNFPCGYTYSGGNFYRHQDLNNAFTTMRESWDGALTIWHDWHTRLAHYGRIVQMPPAPAWIQIIHGQNISNRIRGHLAPPNEIHAQFAFPREDVAVQSPSALRQDRIRFLLLRQPLEAIRRAGRVLIPRTFHGDAFTMIRLFFAKIGRTRDRH
jgi:hypothetical protein